LEKFRYSGAFYIETLSRNEIERLQRGLRRRKKEKRDRIEVK